MTYSNLNAQNWIIGGNVGASAVGSKVLPWVVFIHYRPTNGVVCQVLFHPGKPSVAGKWWRECPAALGHLDRQAQNFKFLTICKNISIQSSISAA
jgi:hypothetical protein